MAKGDSIDIEVVYAETGAQVIVPLTVPPGTTAGEAVARAALTRTFPQLDIESAPIGVFGKVVEPSRVLRRGDRVEVYRKLRIDPKQARRLRATKKMRDGKQRRGPTSSN